MQLNSLHEFIESIYEKFWHEHKKRSGNVRSINFGEWVYKSVIKKIPEKLKMEQMLVNLLDSLNYFERRS